jgi:hypothetical protein
MINETYKRFDMKFEATDADGGNYDTWIKNGVVAKTAEAAIKVGRVSLKKDYLNKDSIVNLIELKCIEDDVTVSV